MRIARGPHAQYAAHRAGASELMIAGAALIGLVRVLVGGVHVVRPHEGEVVGLRALVAGLDDELVVKVLAVLEVGAGEVFGDGDHEAHRTRLAISGGRRRAMGVVMAWATARRVACWALVGAARGWGPRTAGGQWPGGL